MCSSARLATTWISTLAIHEDADRGTAIGNLRRFHELGGRIRYGTDMGNGPTPVGPNAARSRRYPRPASASTN